jgi:hypothetical protein
MFLVTVAEIFFFLHRIGLRSKSKEAY